MSKEQCQCEKTDGTRCTRMIPAGQKFCWQHQNCKKIYGGGTLKKSPAKSPAKVSPRKSPAKAPPVKSPRKTARRSPTRSAVKTEIKAIPKPAQITPIVLPPSLKSSQREPKEGSPRVRIASKHEEANPVSPSKARTLSPKSVLKKKTPPLNSPVRI
jgi:hypothetical protein